MFERLKKWWRERKAIDVYLDDVRNPPPHRQWTVARTVAEAWDLLLTGRVRYMSLDHDLGENQPTGKALVMMMAESNRWPMYKPLVHSANPYGRYCMVELIERYGPYWSNGERRQ